MTDRPKCAYCGVRRTQSSLTITGDLEMHGGCRKLWKRDQEAASTAVRRFKCDTCGRSGVQRGPGQTQKRHYQCRGEWQRRYALANRPPRPTIVAFVPSSFDESLARGRQFYHAGLHGDDYPDPTHLVSAGDKASYALGQRHAKEFAQ
jgi:hypothetical protein